MWLTAVAILLLPIVGSLLIHAVMRKRSYKPTEMIRQDAGVIIVLARDAFRTEARCKETENLFASTVNDEVCHVVLDLSRIERCFWDDGALYPIKSLLSKLLGSKGNMALVRPSARVEASYEFQALRQWTKELMPIFESGDVALKHLMSCTKDNTGA
jgi:hypothetical protein